MKKRYIQVEAEFYLLSPSDILTASGDGTQVIELGEVSLLGQNVNMYN